MVVTYLYVQFLHVNIKIEKYNYVFIRKHVVRPSNCVFYSILICGYIQGAFHCGKDPGKFGRNSTGKICFAFFWPENSGSPYLWRRSLIWVGIFRPRFSAPFLTNWFFTLTREFWKGLKNGKSHSCWLPRFNQKMLFDFQRVSSLICDWSS